MFHLFGLLKKKHPLDTIIFGFAFNYAAMNFGIFSWGSLVAITTPYLFTGFTIAFFVYKNVLRIDNNLII